MAPGESNFDWRIASNLYLESHAFCEMVSQVSSERDNREWIIPVQSQLNAEVIRQNADSGATVDEGKIIYLKRPQDNANW